MSLTVWILLGIVGAAMFAVLVMFAAVWWAATRPEREARKGRKRNASH